MSKTKRKNSENEDGSKRGPTWEGYYTRRTKTKREKEIAERRKRKQKERDNPYFFDEE